MQRTYICKKLDEMIAALHEAERKKISDILVRYISRKKISTTSMESAAKNLVISKITAFAEDPTTENKSEVMKLILYLREAIV